MPIELDNTSINVINSADTFQVDFVKSKGSYTEKVADNYNIIEYPAQWTYSDTDASVYHLDNVGIGTYPSNTKILNVQNGINLTDDLYLNTALISTPKYKHTHIRENNKYFPDIVPSISPMYIPNSNEYQIYSFVYDDSNNNGNGQTEYTINFHQETECDILIVAGGGGGGYDRAGGGGGGGLVFQQNVSLKGEVIINVGNGGVINSDDTIPGGNGSNSSINDIIALGGGGGAGEQSVASDGGSGGGSAYGYSSSHYGEGLQPTQTPNIGYGNRGGDARNLSSTASSRGGGGGGGAGSRGLEATSNSVGGAGGDGLSGIGNIDFKTHFGLPEIGIGEYIASENKVYFAGGGGAGETNDGQSNATDFGLGGKGGGSNGRDVSNNIEGALLNSGGGGGGGGTPTARGAGANGGSGIVIIRCKIVTSDLNIPVLSGGAITELNKFDQYNTLTFNYDTNYLKYDYYPELTNFNDSTNLIAWYKFDVVPTNGATLTNYGSGGTAYDATLNIASNGIERLEGYNAQYRYHWKSNAASGNYISVPGNILQSLYENGHTICFWAKDASTSDNDLTLIATNSGASDVYIRINSPWSNNNAYYDNGNGNGPYKRIGVSSGISANQLVFWTFTRENISSTQMILKVYRDGIQIASVTGDRFDFNTSSTSSIFAIGYNMPAINSDFLFKNKTLEDFRIYDRALIQEEIAQLHLEFTNNKPHAHYKFNDPNNLGLDSTSNFYDATIYGTPEHISLDTISFNVGDGSQYLLFPTEVIKDSGTTREELTFSIWVNKQESNTGTANYFGIDNDTNTDLSKTIFFGQSGSGATYIHVRYGSSNVNINTAFDNRAIDVWNHYVLVLRKDGSNANIKFYVNGIEYTAYNSNVAWIELDDYLKINKWQTGTYNNVNKHIRDFRVYNIALSASQIRYIYSSSSSVYNQSKYTLQFDTDTECDFLVVAGGGGGCGNNIYHAGGGGGAGELLEKYNITFSANTLYTIIVGNGGLGQPAKTSPAIEGYDSGIYTGADGDTPFYHSKGGGRGGNGYYPDEQIFDATSGGSGGGAGMISGANNNVNGLSVKYNTDGRGHDGKVNVGNDAGSGGGAGSIGEYASSSLGQAQSLPGKGYTSYITGEAVTYASGGYGGWQYSRNTANAGKGSGGWGYGGPQGQDGFPGGNGIDGTVIIRYKYVNTKPAPTITYSMNSWTYTDDGNVYYMGNVGIGINDPTATLDVVGNISATAKPFKIQHPLDNSKTLYHGNIECPRYDNLYRGRATIVGGTCIVDIDSECNDTGGLIEGTFEALNTDSQLYLQNNQTFDNVKGTIENGKIHIECENTEDEITINWIVIAERKDADVVKLNNTDSNGKMICEYFK